MHMRVVLFPAIGNWIDQRIKFLLNVAVNHFHQPDSASTGEFGCHRLEVDGHKIQGIALNYNLVGQIMGTMLIDNAYFTNLSPGVNVLILNLNTGMVESSYTFHDGKVVKCY